MDTQLSDAIVTAIREIVDRINPDVAYVPKYGGEVLVPDPDNPKDFVGGIFTYTDHVSLEFSQGANLVDPDGYLEGKGKARRHLKFTSEEDVDTKGTAQFLEQVPKA